MILNYQKINRYERELYCPKCHIYSIREDEAPKCYNCDSNLLKVVYDPITGNRITGARRTELIDLVKEKVDGIFGRTREEAVRSNCISTRYT